MTIPDDVRERLAAVQHEIWAHWMRHLFGVSAPQLDGSVVIPPARVERWQRQMNTPYVDLTDREQESDRHQADKILATLDVSAAPDVMTIPDYVRPRPRWVYEGEVTAECPGGGNDADIRPLDKPEASCPHCGSVMTCYEEYGDDDATDERVIVYRCDECGGLWEYEIRRRPEVTE